MSADNIKEAFNSYKDQIALSLISGGEGKRVRGFLERHVNFKDFEAGWVAALGSLKIVLPSEVTNVTNKDFEQGRDSVVNIIESIGIKVK